MTITNGYLTLPEFKAGLEISTAGKDALAEECIEAASRDVDAWCGRIFYVDANPTVQVYKPDTLDLSGVDTDDISTTVGLVVKTGWDGTFPTTLTSYELEPINGLGPNGQPGWPYNRIRLINSWFAIPLLPWGRQYTVQVTAKYGWAAVPTPVKAATRRLAQLYYEARNAPFGVVAFGDAGGVRISNDMIAQKLLTPFRRVEAFAGIG
jgi:hypothetical protein